ncbi:glycoside hydrolase domain-containing protein [Streptomyces sp. NRRL WC-3618]|uniref:glycoside hydrolase domain-containing protein n=1 Tax=Streptomyces sp. NRRL WC-3618 TaxID=1519490 RepID=UPI0006AFE1B6|nr:glycoside hydrolase domain-containing protein [Streptomyces sp. NRRL WC-3618]
MDQKVLDAQKWVNATYANVAGYQACPETGRTGWSTMHALTMGLQHELGISPVVASFGPGTLAKLQAIGDIGFGWNANSNIVRIIQHGLFCKGYWGANGFGEYGAVTTEAVKLMRDDMGLPDGGAGTAGGQITPALFKCVLNMDAYVRVVGGTDEVRAIQRWLNGRYWQKSAFGIGPCDGIYSRDVQKALMTGLQYELGLAAPNGNFGPATQAALRTQNLGLGNSGVLVQMFSAACVFNSPVPSGTSAAGTPTTWRSTFNDTLVEWVKIFQRFSKLPDSGRADYQTWAQLLVSMGDADRPATGSDTRWEITPSRARYMRDNGYQVVGRYLYDPPGSTLDKEIKPGELETIFGAGLKVFPIYQDNARRLADFTYTAGYQHALNAHSLAVGYGFNRGTTIYFSVDYDATQDEIDSAVVPYFHGVAAGLAYNGKRYIHGVYGSRNVCTNVTKQTGARYSFVSGMSYGFSGNLGFPIPANWSFNQIKEIDITNGSDFFELDRDVISGADPGQSSVNRTAGPADGFISYLTRLLAIAREYGKGNPNQLVMEYVRHISYGGGDWDFLIGEYDGDFVNFANGKGMSVMEGFKDPYTGYELGAEHLMASANGHFVAWKPSNPRSVNEGDVAGWGGDLLTFYADWRHAVETYPSGYAFAMAKLAKVGVASSFGFNDLIEDADAWLLADAVRNQGKDIVTAVTDLYNGGGGLRRFQRYWDGRFNGNAEDAKFLAHNILTAADDKEVVAAQLGLVTVRGGIKTLPAMLSYDDLERLEQGFVDTLLARTGQESRMAATYRKNHDTYLRAARSRARAHKE